MNVLFLTTVLPARKLHGSEIASQNIVEALQQAGCMVTVLGYGRKEDGALHKAAHEVLVADRAVETKKAKFKAMGWFALSLIKQMPYSAAKYLTRRYIKQVQSLLSAEVYDAIVIDHAQLGWLLDVIDHPRVILVAHNLEHDMYRQHYQRSSNRLAKWVYGREAATVEALEAKTAASVAEVWALTQHDANYFAQFTKARTLSLPSGFVSRQTETVAKMFDIGIIGSWAWKPNEEGLRWFLEAVYPLLPESLTIHVAGRGADWLSDRYPNLVYQGFVEDSQVFMMQARVMAIPTLSGGGIQIKTLDAIASGSHIVATAIALRGIANPPQTVAIADLPRSFAQQLMAAINAEQSPEAAQEAQQWYYDRQTLFLNEVKQAISELTASVGTHFSRHADLK
ncbi:glycosyltransferase [Cyanobacteria bacterium FACHB-DQ100]|nr:glycosyltransferase [Cyanobacteria bacterium FACHB-DQ100]